MPHTQHNVLTGCTTHIWFWLQENWRDTAEGQEALQLQKLKMPQAVSTAHGKSCAGLLNCWITTPQQHETLAVGWHGVNSWEQAAQYCVCVSVPPGY